MKSHKKLENPIWNSLSETHKQYALDFGNIKFYHPDYSPFGALQHDTNDVEAITEYSKLLGNFLIVGHKPKLPSNVVLKSELIGLQMILEQNIELNIKESIRKLNESHLHEVIQLVKLVYPEYFKKKTFFMGNYYGIFINQKLVAITGERMQMDDYIEVSAVITHPEHTGKGYAKQLIKHTVDHIFNRNKIPILHVAESNVGPINLYKTLGFITRRKMSFWNISRNL
ncbi:GNAT family N-acetyltransferase [Yeosuana sp. MJ-SS3]|uniref:GNAT family N-acetyltransferase n=1 Tax=Gilvirhabdus luticola TaxID=3079858 RepID=A0ABU3UA42_9FLAO|nr:GNAT family N-acetyltransferase [Yeosuana sp. MJ-SS3]MDU8887281.1 GNAT family N-acetyltransferase [Yeosuana sp. MJ-SS3]